MNNLNLVVGSYMDTNNASHGFIYDNGRFTSIDDPDGIGTTVVNGVNDDSQLVGFYVDAEMNTDGFVARR